MHEELAEILKQCSTSTAAFAKVFLPERFDRQFSSLHYSLLNALDRPEKPKLVIAAPRGFGKTSIVTVAYPLRLLCYQQARFILPCSLTETAAIGHSEDVKMEITGNELILKTFGSLRSKVWAKELWETSKNTRVLPRGAGQQMRGHLYKGKRPQVIILDDIEDPVAVLNDQNRLKLKKWLNSDVSNAIDRAAKDWRIQFIGTVLHEDSLLMNCLNDPSWASVRLELCDDDFTSNCPDFISTEGVRKLVEEHRANGLLDEFYREYMNRPIAAESAVFKKEYFRYYEEKDIDGEGLLNVLLMDPAKTVSATSCETALVVAGIDIPTGKIYVRDVLAGKYSPQEAIDFAVESILRYNILVAGLEVTGLNDYITYPFKTAMREKGISIYIEELKPRGDKMERIGLLSPFYASGRIYHNRSATAKLEGQLLQYPRPKKADIMDAFSHVVHLLSAGNKYFAMAMMDRGEYCQRQYARTRSFARQQGALSADWRMV